MVFESFYYINIYQNTLLTMSHSDSVVAKDTTSSVVIETSDELPGFLADVRHEHKTCLGDFLNKLDTEDPIKLMLECLDDILDKTDCMFSQVYLEYKFGT